jgi:hypothetical protein
MGWHPHRIGIVWWELLVTEKLVSNGSFGRAKVSGHTSQYTATSVAISDRAVSVDAVLAGRQVAANAVLSVIELTDGARGFTRGREAEAAARIAGNKCVGTGGQDRKGSEVPHFKLV